MIDDDQHVRGWLDVSFDLCMVFFLKKINSCENGDEEIRILKMLLLLLLLLSPPPLTGNLNVNRQELVA